METESRVAVIGIVVDQTGDTEELNKVLHQYGQYIVGRMGIPYHKRNVNIISVVIDAPGDVISALSGKLGMLRGISSKALYLAWSEGFDLYARISINHKNNRPVCKLSGYLYNQ